MSEFVECQNCGRKFFAENLDCPYCSDEQEIAELIAEVGDERRSGGRMFGILFSSFKVVLIGIALLSFVAVSRTPFGTARTLQGLEATFAVVLFVGVVQRRRWARMLAIVFILVNAALGVVSLAQRGQASSLAWGPGPLALLLFLVPFLSRQARDHFSR
ncbi:MAG: hypothetical protein ACE5G2_02560 [Candidatus Krumholzibacteriia bacterium]